MWDETAQSTCNRSQREVLEEVDWDEQALEQPREQTALQSIWNQLDSMDASIMKWAHPIADFRYISYIASCLCLYWFSSYGLVPELTSSSVIVRVMMSHRFVFSGWAHFAKYLCLNASIVSIWVWKEFLDGLCFWWMNSSYSWMIILTVICFELFNFVVDLFRKDSLIILTLLFLMIEIF